MNTAILFFSFCVILYTRTLQAVFVNIRNYRGYIQNIHNYLRSLERGADMKFMPLNVEVISGNADYQNYDEIRRTGRTTDFRLERAAQRWADTCVFEHQMRGYGENLAFISSTGRTPNPGYVIQESIRQWYNERPLYRFGAQSCGQACHYTQMIWARTSRLGCAMSYCNVLADRSGRTYRNAQYFVCFYTPQGNYIGQLPFTPGRPCSRCPPGNSCYQGLCFGPDFGNRAGRRRRSIAATYKSTMTNNADW